MSDRLSVRCFVGMDVRPDVWFLRTFLQARSNRVDWDWFRDIGHDGNVEKCRPRHPLLLQYEVGHGTS